MKQAAPQAAAGNGSIYDLLKKVRHHWSEAYAIGPDPDGSGYRADRRDGRGAVTAGDPEALWDALVADFAEQPVRWPHGADEVGRMRAFLAAYPGAETWTRPPSWFGSFPLGGDDRWLWTGPANDLRTMLDRLEELPALAALCAAIELQYPGWQVRRSLDGRWRAARVVVAGYPLWVDAANSIGLLDELSWMTRAEARWPRWIFWRRGDEWGATHPSDLERGPIEGSVDGPDLDYVEASIADVEQALASRDRRPVDEPDAS